MANHPRSQKNFLNFHESIRFPWPLNPVTIIVKKRNAQNTFETIWITEIDPQSRNVNPADIIHTEKVNQIVNNGPSQDKLDIVLLGDGYTAKEMDKFISDAKRLTNALLSAEPFKTRKTDINVWAVQTPSQESGL